MQNTSKMMIRFHIPFQVIMNVTCFAADETSAHFITRVNKRLAGHVAKRFQSPSLMSCSHSCLRNSWCTSTNFKESLKENGKGTCELNKHEIAPINEHTELTDQPGVTFSMFLKVPLGRNFIGLFRPNSVAEYRILFIFLQKTEQQTFHPNIF